MTKEDAIRWTLSKELERPEWAEAMAAVRLELLAKLSFPRIGMPQLPPEFNALAIGRSGSLESCSNPASNSSNKIGLGSLCIGGFFRT